VIDMAAAANTISIVPKKIRVIPNQKPVLGRYDLIIRQLQEMYGVGDHAAACDAILKIFDHVNEELRPPGPIVSAEIQRVMHAALTVFTQPTFRIPERYAAAFLFNCPVIANALAAAVDITPDAWRASVAGDPQEAFKACVLSSPRDMTPFPFSRLMDASPELASAWFCQTFKTAFVGNVDARVRKNLIELARSLDDRFVACRDMQEPYFLVTYLGDDQAERNVKYRINCAIKQTSKSIVPGKAARIVAVASDNWMPGHSVWRTLKGYIDALRPEFETVLIHSLRDADVLDTDGFSRTIKIPYDGTKADFSQLNDQGFAALIIPDVGMTGWSINLANHRLAPVQVMMTGHPVSTFGSEIDWFLSGDLTEECKHRHWYNEKVYRVPGFGAIHEEPTYQPIGAKKDFDGLVVNCSWYGQKVTHEWVSFVGDIIRKTRKPVKLNIFAGGAATSRGGFGAFLRSFDKALGGVTAELYPHLDYAEYMAKLEEGDFAIDCYPFAGSNTVSDNLHLRKPVVCLEGDRWFNRIGPAMLRECGTHSTIAKDHGQFRDILTRMIVEDAWREDITRRLQTADLSSTVYRRQGAKEFAGWLAGQIESART
jgi:hypothetical protein